MKTATFTISHLKSIGLENERDGVLSSNSRTVTFDMTSDGCRRVVNATRRSNDKRPRTDPRALSLDSDIWGPVKWREIHDRPFADQWTPGTPDTMWIERWAWSIPCGKCRAKAAQFIRLVSIPVAFGTREEYYQWTTEFHDFVNEALGRPRLEELYAAAD